ncbi:hypothetical protein [Gallaecimonas mangrovi]|uniref:hypothetical protein n=1 Tax=Gallaecimonas mangrovi TaxID=2291597 RepID=UPI000E205435|nr:hypothetical protein [Gallaecimonas mangrovi]
MKLDLLLALVSQLVLILVLLAVTIKAQAWLLVGLALWLLVSVLQLGWRIYATEKGKEDGHQ